MSAIKTFSQIAKWFLDLDENCIADLDGAEALHEMSARRNRRAKKRKKTQEDKIKRAKALLQPHPGKIVHFIRFTNLL